MRPGRCLLVLGLLWLAGCAPVPGAAPAEAGRKGLLSSVVEKAAAPKAAKPLLRLTLAGGDVPVVPPEGYCIDPKSRRGGAQRSFAAIASCRILTGGQVGGYVEPVLITVAAGSRGAAEDLPSPELLAKARRAPLLSGSRTPDAVFAHLGQGGAAILPGGDPKHWRTIFVLNDRLVGAALYAPAGSPMAGPEGAELLMRLKARMVAAVAKPATPKAAPGAAPKAAPGATAPQRRKRGLFAGLTQR
ncbi:hypothetical protein JYP51_05665 [Ponticoccus gilvus]|nr:hypothetical protein [Enemella evansiae]